MCNYRGVPVMTYQDILNKSGIVVEERHPGVRFSMVLKLAIHRI